MRPKPLNHFKSVRISDYYISGSDEYPNALMGLNKKYTLDSAFWKKIDPSPLRFRELVLQMQSGPVRLANTSMARYFR